MKLTGQAPRYSDSYYWAALPAKNDPSDLIPKGLKTMNLQEVDVFFIHPTSYIRKKHGKTWNADLLNNHINEITDNGAIKYQASIFNEQARVYAPRYRQMVYSGFSTKDQDSKQKALDLAYEDIYNAFLYFYDNFNQNRPIAIVGHSQGAYLALRLLKEVFDNEPMKNRLVIAYIPGFPIPVNSFKFLKPCQFAEETSCVCSWRSFKKGFDPDWLLKEEPAIVTNPLIWTTEPIDVPSSENLGWLLKMEDGIYKNGPGARVYKSILWVDKPKFKGSFLLRTKNYHRGDFNLFYMNIRHNFKTRVGAYWKG
ncbi:MAG: DUF3089 domain-containing protein [Saprospiraceae bacterium]|nr:DUF3089 domain-containing protein [Saprospiraceae bacterium]